MPSNVGMFTNVPNAGDPIRSDWPQSVSPRAVHSFATVAARDAWASPPAGAVCVTTDTNTMWQRMSTTWIPISGNTIVFRVIGGGAGQSVTSGAPATVTWAGGSESLDPNNIHNAGIVTIPTGWGGRWRFDWAVIFNTAGTGLHAVWLSIGTVRYGSQETNHATALSWTASGSSDVLIAAGGTAQVTVYHTAVGTLSINQNDTIAYFQGRYVGPN